MPIPEFTTREQYANALAFVLVAETDWDTLKAFMWAEGNEPIAVVAAWERYRRAIRGQMEKRFGFVLYPFE